MIGIGGDVLGGIVCYFGIGGCNVVVVDVGIYGDGGDFVIGDFVVFVGDY